VRPRQTPDRMNAASARAPCNHPAGGNGAPPALPLPSPSHEIRRRGPHKVEAGDGGRGCTSFGARSTSPRRPQRRDGGDGGDVVLAVDPGLSTLVDLSYPQHLRADAASTAAAGPARRPRHRTRARVPAARRVRRRDRRAARRSPKAWRPRRRRGAAAAAAAT
jgi:hypothetical protein